MAFKGAMVRKTYPGGNQSIPNNSPTMSSWSVVDYDTDSFFDSNYPTRLTVPAGVSMVRLIGQAVWTKNSSGMRQLVIKKNGQFFPGDPVITYLPNGRTTTDMVAISPPLPVEEGDYFEFEVFQDRGGSLDLLASTGTFFSIEVLE